jgi:hypothetical protein
MPAPDTVLLPICVGLTLLGVIATGVAWRRGSRGRVIQGIGVALAPIALYFTGLLRVIWDTVVNVFTWAGSIVFSPAIWFGLSLLGVCIVLWVVGGMVTRRSATRSAGKSPAKPVTRGSAKPGTAVAPSAASNDDDDMAEIEALLKKHGIE